MCKDLVAQCGNCFFTRHVWWEWCPDHLLALKEAIQACREPFPHARDCPDRTPKVICKIGLLACPNPICIESPITKAIRAKRDAHMRALREMQLEKLRQEQAKRDLFARKYFRKRPIPIFEYSPSSSTIADEDEEEEEEENHELSGDWSDDINDQNYDEEHGGTDIESCHDEGECDELDSCPPDDLRVELPYHKLIRT